ncbi:hypothetical protein LUZ60_000627 [Juncus effusus]|nr:hypothetical protein LUZ60_000627 [Juncus effusus]
MGKGSRSAVKHQMFKDKARNRVDDLQDKFSDLQSAIKDSRTADAALLEAQVHQMLREWKAELNEPSPASSLQGNTHVSSDPSDILRHLQLREVEDDATSKPMELAGNPNPNPNPKSEPDEVARSQQACGTHSQLVGAGAHSDGANTEYHHEASFYINQADAFLYSDEEFKTSLTNPSQDALTQLLEQTCHVDYSQFLSSFSSPSPHPNPNPTQNPNPNPTQNPNPNAHMSFPPAFLRPKCALWDCNRPAQDAASWQCVDYCSAFHASLARNECQPGMTPVLRPGGIDLKDGPLFGALSGKIQGKDVGIPVCEGAVSTKSPWNSHELFNLAVLEGESIREWLFFDKPRRAFESGNRKQRSLPDYTGRGWHESRKQVMKEFNGLKRSYYMDPQPLPNFEWHLYEYEIEKCDVYVLCRLEFKVKGGKSKSGGKSGGKRGKGSNSKSEKGLSEEGLFDFDQMGFLNEGVVYGPSLPPYGYNGNVSNNNHNMDKLEGYYGT